MTDGLEEWGKRWNKKAKSDVALDPNADELTLRRISLGVPAIDAITGGGIPRGRSTVLFGEPGSGKTFFSQMIIAAAQKVGGTAMFFDIERTYDPKWFAMSGVDTHPDKLIVAHPRSLEQGFDMIIDALENVCPQVIVVDSIPAMVPKNMMLDDRGKTVEMAEKDFRGLSARKMTEGIARVTQYNKTTALVFINQLRVDMGKSFGNPESMPGGKAVKFYTAMRLRVRRGEWLHDKSKGADEELFDLPVPDKKKEAKRTGFVMRLRTEKTKVSSTTWEECEFKFFFNGSVDTMGSLITLAVERGVIEAARGYYQVPGVEHKLHGIGQLETLLRENKKLKNSIIKGIKEVA